MVGWSQGCSPGELAVISRKRSNRLLHLDVVLFPLLVISFLLVAGLGGKWTVRCISLFNYLNAAELQNQPPVVLRVQFCQDIFPFRYFLYQIFLVQQYHWCSILFLSQKGMCDYLVYFHSMTSDNLEKGPRPSREGFEEVAMEAYFVAIAMEEVVGR